MMEKPTENANFQSKLKELATFAEAILKGTNESHKKELWSKVGNLFRKRIDSFLPSWRLERPSKKIKKENVKVDLPDEIWIKILGFMNKTDVFKSFALTCKHFNKLSLDPSIIKSLSLYKMDELDHEHVISVLKRSRFLKKIEIDCCKSSDSLLLTAFKFNNVLKSVKIRDFNKEENYLISVNKILEESGNKLEILSLRGFFSLKGVTIMNLVNLKKLYLGINSYLTSKNLITLAQNCKLETLHTTVSCDDQLNLAFKIFLQAMEGKMKDLKIVHKNYNDISLSWTKYLSLCQSLEEIQIRYGPISNLKGLSELFNLKLLKLYYIAGNDSDNQKSQKFSNFFKTLDLENMKDLAISHMDISLEHLTILANRHFPNLKHICLFWCEKLKIDEGTLKKMISNSPQLKGIHIDETKIELTDEQLYDLMEQSGVTIGVGSTRGQQFKKYLRYQLPGSVEKYSHRIECNLCGYTML